MRILITLTYFRPHHSGLTIYTERLARGLTQLGESVTVLTSRFDRKLATREEVDGVQIQRLNVLARISKGVLMPGIALAAWQQVRRADVVNLHVPQLDAAPIALLARLMARPVVLTYHCDMNLPRGFIHRVANLVSHLANYIAAWAANVIVTNTQDYAEHSSFLQQYTGKLRIIPPPVELPEVDDAALERFRVKHSIDRDAVLIGMVARLATEKGVEYLMEALPDVIAHYPTARVLFVGQYQDVLGEEAYAAMLAPLIRALGKHWCFLGVITSEELAAFYHICDVTVLPSINSTESYGMVQVEAMSCGTPVVATNLPGVRQPVRETGMGRIVAPRDPGGLRDALLDLLGRRGEFRGRGSDIAARYSPRTIAEEYRSLFQELTGKA